MDALIGRYRRKPSSTPSWGGGSTGAACALNRHQACPKVFRHLPAAASDAQRQGRADHDLPQPPAGSGLPAPVHVAPAVLQRRRRRTGLKPRHPRQAHHARRTIKRIVSTFRRAARNCHRHVRSVRSTMTKDKKAALFHRRRLEGIPAGQCCLNPRRAEIFKDNPDNGTMGGRRSPAYIPVEGWRGVSAG